MNVIPFIGFYYRQRTTINKLMGTENKGLKLFINLLHANLPIFKKHWPELNENSLLDDFIKTLDEASYQTLIASEGDENGRI